MPIFLYLLIYLVTFLVFTYYPGIASDLKKHLAANDISFVAAISTAFLSDWTAMSNRPIYLRRFLDGALQSIILVGGSVIVYLWLVDIEHTRVPNLMRLITMAGGIGFLIGFIVPNWYRNSYVIEPDHEDDESRTGRNTPMNMLAT